MYISRFFFYAILCDQNLGISYLSILIMSIVHANISVLFPVINKNEFYDLDMIKKSKISNKDNTIKPNKYLVQLQNNQIGV